METINQKFPKGTIVSVVICGETLFTGEVVSARKIDGRPYLLYSLNNPLTHKHYVEYERNLQQS